MTVGEFLENFKDVDLNSKVIFLVKINNKTEEISNVDVNLNPLTCEYVELEIKDRNTYDFIF